MKRSDACWLAIFTIAIGHNLDALRHGDEQLCDAVARYRLHAPILTDVAVIVTAGHIAKRWPKRLDPWANLFAAMSWWFTRRLRDTPELGSS